MAAARELFNRGITAAREERWEEARGHFESSHRIVQRSSTLLNLAGAQAETGLLIQATESYRRFIANAGPRERGLVPSAEEALRDAESRLAHVVVSISGLEGDDEVWLGEQVIGHASLGIPLPLNPGDHTITIARAGAPAGESDFSTAEGETVEVHVTAELAAGAAPGLALMPDAPPEEEGGSILSSPWLWTGIGVVALAAVIIAIVFATSGTNPPHMGNLGAGTLTFE
jgi:hypothetical protein